VADQGFFMGGAKVRVMARLFLDLKMNALSNISKVVTRFFFLVPILFRNIPSLMKNTCRVEYLLSRKQHTKGGGTAP